MQEHGFFLGRPHLSNPRCLVGVGTRPRESGNCQLAEEGLLGKHCRHRKNGGA